MRPLAFVLLLAAASPALAQTAGDSPFYPLAVGDAWVYARYDGAPGAEPVMRGFGRREVVGDTVLDGAAWRLVRVTRYAPDRTVVRDALCAVRRTAAPDWFAWQSMDDATGECRVYEATLGGRPNASGGEVALGHASARADSVRIGIETVAADVLALGVDVGEMAGMAHVYAVRFAAGVGYLGYAMEHHGGHADGETLAFARVGGQTFGSDPLAEGVAVPAVDAVPPAHTGGHHH